MRKQVGKEWEGRHWGLGRAALRFVAISRLPVPRKASCCSPSPSPQPPLLKAP